jgi:hypothetical protein
LVFVVAGIAATAGVSLIVDWNAPIIPRRKDHNN